MNEFPLYGMFTKLDIYNRIHRQINDFLSWIFLLLRFNDFNCNKVQEFLVYLFYFGINFEFISCICGDF